jgi:hypothetical protein
MSQKIELVKMKSFHVLMQLVHILTTVFGRVTNWYDLTATKHLLVGVSIATFSQHYS